MSRAPFRRATFFAVFCLAMPSWAPVWAQTAEEAGALVANASISPDTQTTAVRQGPAPTDPVPGGVYLWPLPAGASDVHYQKRPVLVQNGHAMVGINIKAAPGQHTLNYFADGQDHTHTFVVAGKEYPESRITIANPKMVNPDPESLTRIREEAVRQGARYRAFRTQAPAVSPFIMPVEGITSSPFGFRRIFNGEPRNPHSGLDIAADTGTPVLAPAGAKVTLTDNLYFNGNTVFLDHGQGLVTMYCHLSEIKVNENDSVAQGDTIGLVGATGRVTGPHLHWSVSLNGVRVDPVTVISVLQQLNAPKVSTFSETFSGAIAPTLKAREIPPADHK